MLVLEEMETIDEKKLRLRLFDSPSNLFVLMEEFEEFTHFCYLNDISFWIDWGTILGAIRHSNIIPWDYDSDVCLTQENYEKLLKLFENKNNKIGNLVCYPDGYNDPHGLCWVQSKKHIDLGPNVYGVDCTSYEVGENSTKALMSQANLDAYPVAPASFHFANDDLFPLKLIPFVGNYVFTPYKSLDKMKLAYGEEEYLKYHPVEKYDLWLQYNSDKLFLLDSPFKTVPEVSELVDGLKLDCPFIIKNVAEFNVDIKHLNELFTNEHNIQSWYETEDHIFKKEISNNGKNLMNQWEKDELISNVFDSPCSHYEFLPKVLLDRINNLEEDDRHQALCYLLTNKNTLRKFQCNSGSSGWVYLKQGKNLWWFISPEHQEELNKYDYSLEKIRERSFTQLVFLHNNYLWGKIYIVLQETNDFVYFPRNWAYRVFTYDRAFGIAGYVK